MTSRGQKMVGMVCSELAVMNGSGDHNFEQDVLIKNNMSMVIEMVEEGPIILFDDNTTHLLEMTSSLTKKERKRKFTESVTREKNEKA